MGKTLLGELFVVKRIFIINVSEVIHQTEFIHGVVGEIRLMTARDE